MSHTNSHTIRLFSQSPFAAALRRATALAGALALVIATAPGARAATMSYTISVSSDYSLLLTPNSPAVQSQVAQKSESVVNTANNNPVFMVTNTSATADISEVILTLTDADTVFNALKILNPTSALPQSPFASNIWGGPSKSVDIVLPTVLAPHSSLTFATNLGPLGGFPSINWSPGYENILWQALASGNASLTVTYVDPTVAGDPKTTVTNVLPALDDMTTAVTVTSACCNTDSTSVYRTSFSTGGEVPEPASLLLIVLGFLPLGVPAWRKHKRTGSSPRA